MKPAKTKRKEISVLVESLVAEATSDGVKKKIRAIDQVCSELIKRGAEVTVSLVVKYMVQNGYKMSSQSLYNKRGGSNPYRKIYDSWSDYSVLCQSDSANVKGYTVGASNLSGTALLDESELKSIDDPVLRYKLGLVISELSSLRKQNDLLRQIKNMNVIQVFSSEHLIGNESREVILDQYELDILENFVDSNTKLSFDENGCLIARRAIPAGTRVSEDSLLDALRKVLKSYKRG